MTDQQDMWAAIDRAVNIHMAPWNIGLSSDRWTTAPPKGLPHVDWRKGDHVFVHSRGFVGLGIRLKTRARGERPTWVNHVAMVVDVIDGHPILMDAQPPRVQRRTVYAYLGELVAVYRPTNIPQDDLDWIVKRCCEYEGDRYGLTKIVLQFFGLGHLSFVDNWPICSYSVGVPMAECRPPMNPRSHNPNGYSFGAQGEVVDGRLVTAKGCTPDDLWDFERLHEDKYKCLLDLRLYECR